MGGEAGAQGHGMHVLKSFQDRPSRFLGHRPHLRLRQRQERGLGGGRLHYREDPFGHRHRNQPGTGPVCGPSGQRSRAGHRARSGHNQDHAGGSLVRFRFAPRDEAGGILGLDPPQLAANQVGREADVGHLHLAGMACSRVEDQPGLETTERDGGVGEHRDSPHQPGLTLHARGDVDRDDRTSFVVDHLDGAGEGAFRRASEAGAEDGVHQDVGPRGLAAQARLAVALPDSAAFGEPPQVRLRLVSELGGIGEQGHPHGHPGPLQMARSH